jgi:hypothetical protein
VHAEALDEFQRLRAVGGREDVIIRAEDRLQRRQYPLFVVHEDDARLFGSTAARA